MTFRDLNINKQFLNALDELGFVYPTPIQKESFSLIMSGKDVVGIAQTGTGKTFAYLLPLLRMLKFSKKRETQLVVIVPTRELVVQQVLEAEKLLVYSQLKVIGVYGGTNIRTQKAAVMEGADILVATPGRLLDIILAGALKTKSVKKLVIDEVDEMLNLGFMPQLLRVMDLLPAKRQNLMFSATMTEKIEEIINGFFNFPKKIEIAVSGTPVENIEQSGYEIPNFYSKVNLLERILRDDPLMTKVLVFVKSKKIADLLIDTISKDLQDVIGVIHSNKSQNYRFNSLNKFKDGTSRVLIATDIIARGLDISEVSHVVNFDTPSVAIDYIHRIGRTGRADAKGKSITFFTPTDSEYLEKIESLMGMKIDILDLPENLNLSTELLEEERHPNLTNQKNYLGAVTLKNSQGAFHEKKAKNLKVNRAQEKRNARKLAKRKAKRYGKKRR